jgi:peptide/nickel transport system substrate-binding protein
MCPRYDPTDAKRLVRASGFPNPTIHLLTWNLTDSLRLAEAIQAQEAAVGINIVIDTTDQATAVARAAAGNFDAYLGPAWTTCGVPDICMYQFLHTTGSRNWSGYSNPRLDGLLDEARQAATSRAARALYHQAEQLIVDARPMLFLYHTIKYAAVSTRVTGVQFYPDVQLRVPFAQFK